MIIGQSAGIAAALTAQQGIAVQKLGYAGLRARLLAQGQVLDLPVLPTLPTPGKSTTGLDPHTLPGLVLDDSQAELKGPWETSTNFKPHVGHGYLHDAQRGDGQSMAIFRPKIARAGRYDLRIAYSPHPTRAAKIPLTIQSGTRITTLDFDETQPLPPGELFRSAGFVNLDNDQENVITVSNRDTHGFVIIDAIQLLEVTE